jgi:hypothetical protein
MQAAEVPFMFFSDLHVQLLSRGLLNPGEQLLGQTVTGYMPWWAFGLIRRQYLVLATDQRLILVDHRFSFIQPTTQRLHQVDSIAWSSVAEAKVTGLIKKKLKVVGQGERGPISLKMVITNTLFGLLAPMKNNMQGARTVAATCQQMKGGGAPAMLAPAPYGAPAMAPQLQQYSQPPVSNGYGQPQQAYGQNPVPAINAPGYISQPPPSAQPQMQYGAPPAVQSPFDPPRQY